MRVYKRGEPFYLSDLMRMLAKSSLAKLEWSVAKSTPGNVRLFSDELKNWSPAQKYFVYWCSFYDRVYESMERPPDRVIKNDELLEMWLKKQEDKLKVSAEKSWGESSAAVGSSVKTAWSHPEVIVIDGGRGSD